MCARRPSILAFSSTDALVAGGGGRASAGTGAGPRAGREEVGARAFVFFSSFSGAPWYQSLRVCVAAVLFSLFCFALFFAPFFLPPLRFRGAQAAVRSAEQVRGGGLLLLLV